MAQSLDPPPARDPQLIGVLRSRRTGAFTVVNANPADLHDRARYDPFAVRFMDVLGWFEGPLLAADESPAVLKVKWPKAGQC